MEFIQYINNISFRFIQPDSDVSDNYFLWRNRIKRFGIDIEIVNTKLPKDSKVNKRTLKKLCVIPKMSTYAIGAIINKAVSQMDSDQIYLNIGVLNGFSLFAGMLDNKCIGVDNFSEFKSDKKTFLKKFNKLKNKNHKFFEMDFIEYFKTHKGKIGVYFYDAAHGYKYQKAALDLAKPFLAKNAVIIIDDTNWKNPRKATLDFLKENPKFKLIFDKKTTRGQHPTWWNGLMILKKSNS